MTFVETMNKLAAAAPTHLKDKMLAGPGLVTDPNDQVTWAFASDTNSILFVLPSRGSLSVFELPKARPEQEKYILPLFDHETQHNMAVPLGELQAFLGDVVWKEVCPSCKGTSASSEHVICSFCDSTGEVGAEPRYGYIMNRPINRLLLARTLSPFADPTENVDLRVGKHPDGRGDLVSVLLQGSRAVVMAMTPNTEDSEGMEKWGNAPRFPADWPQEQAPAAKPQVARQQPSPPSPQPSPVSQEPAQAAKQQPSSPVPQSSPVPEQKSKK